MNTNNETKEQKLKSLEVEPFAKHVIFSDAYKSLSLDAKIIYLLMLRKILSKPEWGSHDD